MNSFSSKVASPRKRSATDVIGRTFKSVFRPDGAKDGIARYRLAGSGVIGWPTDARTTNALTSLLKNNGIEIRQRSMGSPANANSYQLDAAFLDGGFHATTGNYWFGEKGAWIHGPKALAWVARSLGIGLPSVVRRRTPPKLAPELLDSYEATDFVALSLPKHPIRIGAAAPDELIALMNAQRAGPAIIVTAFNPFSTSLPDDVNQLRQEFLRLDVAESSLEFMQAEGRDPSGRWHAEPSLLVFGATCEQMNRLLVDYQQHAIVSLGTVGVARLVFHPTHAAQSRPVKALVPSDT